MYLSRIILSDFKNIEAADIELSSKINCICGNNGEGKTNLLDAIHYLSMTKSFLSSSDRYTFRHGTQESVVNGTFFKNGSIENIGISIKANGEKIVRKDSKTYKRVSDHIGRMPIVMVSPADTSIINDSAEERRRFINMMLSQTDQEYLRSSIAYNRVLKQRNQLLKQEYISDLLLDTMSEQMSSPAMYIFSKRKEAVESLSKCTAEFYSLISGGKESVSIEYVSELYDDMPLSLFDRSRDGWSSDTEMCLTRSAEIFPYFIEDGPIQDNESNVWCHSDASFRRCFRQVGPLEGVSIDKYGSEGEFRSGFHHRYRSFKG